MQDYPVIAAYAACAVLTGLGVFQVLTLGVFL
jgi:hypothetical protein